MCTLSAQKSFSHQLTQANDIIKEIQSLLNQFNIKKTSKKYN